jgi:hypothetical protein
MAPTLLQQFLVSPGAIATVDLPMVTTDHLKILLAMGKNPSCGVVAVGLKSMSGTGSVVGATVSLTPSLGRVMYAPTGAGMADPDPAMAAVMPSVVQSDESYASIMQLAMHGASQVVPPYAIDELTFPTRSTSTPAHSPWPPSEDCDEAHVHDCDDRAGRVQDQARGPRARDVDREGHGGGVPGG